MRHAPSADRNKEPIANVLRNYRPFAEAATTASEKPTCLEIASGTGQHVSFFAEQFPHVTFQPTEYVGGSAGPEEPAYGDLSPVFASIVAYSGGKANVREPIALDASQQSWPERVETSTWDAPSQLRRAQASEHRKKQAPTMTTHVIRSLLVCLFRPSAADCCNVSYSPYSVTGDSAGASRLLAPEGVLCVYGPFMVDGAHTAESNAAFDERLRSQDASWGVRCSTAIAGEADAHGPSLWRELCPPIPRACFPQEGANA